MIVQLSIIAAVAAIVIAVIIWTSKRKSKKKEGRSSVDIILCRLKIVIGFYQVTNGVLETFSYIKWPGALEVIGRYSEILQMNVFQVAPIHCLLSNARMNAFADLFAMLAMNAAAILMSVLAFGLRKLFLLRSALNRQQKEKKVAQTKEVIYRNSFFFLFLTYLSTCSKTAQVVPLACRKLCIDEEDETCDEYLRADYSINCNSQEYNRSVIVAYCALFYIILLPTASLIALWRQRKVLRGNVLDAESEALEPQEQATGNAINIENEDLEPQEQNTGNVIHAENEDLERQEQNAGNAIHTENEDLEHQEENAGNLIHAENEDLEPQEQNMGNVIQAEKEDLEHQEQNAGNLIHADAENENLEPQEQNTENVIQAENEDLEHREQNAGNLIDTDAENKDLEPQEQNMENVIQAENEDLKHQEQNSGNLIYAVNEDLEPQEQNTGNVIQAENEDLKHQEQNSGNLIHAENEELEPQEQATGNVIHTENEALMPQEQAKGNIVHSENEALEHQEQATGIVMGLRFLFENYHSRAWYWEYIEVIRKLVLTAALIFLGGESRAYVGLAFVTSGLYVVLFSLISPMADPFENRLMLSALSVTFLNLGIGAVSRIPEEGMSSSSIDPYVDGITFNILVVGANTLVITLLVGNY